MAGADRTDPLPSNRFLVEIDAMTVAGFSEVRGLAMAIDERQPDTAADATADAADDSDGGSWWERMFGSGGSTAGNSGSGDVDEEDERVLGTRSPPLELRRGVTEDDSLWEWYDAWLKGEGDSRTVRIVLLDTTGAQVRGWSCRNARPVGWEGPRLVAADSGVAVETFELEHEGIWRLPGL